MNVTGRARRRRRGGRSRRVIRPPGVQMPKYVSFFTYTSESWARMINAPGDRTAALRQVLEPLGGSLETIYWMFGAYDGIGDHRCPRLGQRGRGEPRG